MVTNKAMIKYCNNVLGNETVNALTNRGSLNLNLMLKTRNKKELQIIETSSK